LGAELEDEEEEEDDIPEEDESSLDIFFVLYTLSTEDIGFLFFKLSFFFGVCLDFFR